MSRVIADEGIDWKSEAEELFFKETLLGGGLGSGGGGGGVISILGSQLWKNCKEGDVLAVNVPCFSQRRKVSDEIPSFLVVLCAEFEFTIF
jgi:hypothetical protein